MKIGGRDTSEEEEVASSASSEPRISDGEFIKYRKQYEGLQNFKRTLQRKREANLILNGEFPDLANSYAEGEIDMSTLK